MSDTTAAPPSAMEHETLPIVGMFCASCVRRIESVVGRVDGVTDVTVNLASERASIDYDPTLANVEDLVAAVGASGLRRARRPRGG